MQTRGSRQSADAWRGRPTTIWRAAPRRRGATRRSPSVSAKATCATARAGARRCTTPCSPLAPSPSSAPSNSSPESNGATLLLPLYRGWARWRPAEFSSCPSLQLPDPLYVTPLRSIANWLGICRLDELGSVGMPLGPSWTFLTEEDFLIWRCQSWNLDILFSTTLLNNFQKMIGSETIDLDRVASQCRRSFLFEVPIEGEPLDFILYTNRVHGQRKLENPKRVNPWTRYKAGDRNRFRPFVTVLRFYVHKKTELPDWNKTKRRPYRIFPLRFHGSYPFHWLERGRLKGSWRALYCLTLAQHLRPTRG